MTVTARYFVILITKQVNIIVIISQIFSDCYNTFDTLILNKSPLFTM